jgi:hypothetical protein
VAWWLTVYCRAPIDDLTPARLLAGLRDGDALAPAGVDYLTLAEQYGVDDESAVAAAVASLRAEGGGGAGVACRVFYLDAPGGRPLVVHHWTDAGRIADELAEVDEVRRPPRAARERLRATRAVAAVELGPAQCEGLGLVFAYEIARWLAQRGDGLVVDDDGHWSLVRDGAWADLPLG